MKRLRNKVRGIYLMSSYKTPSTDQLSRRRRRKIGARGVASVRINRKSLDFGESTSGAKMGGKGASLPHKLDRGRSRVFGERKEVTEGGIGRKLKIGKFAKNLEIGGKDGRTGTYRNESKRVVMGGRDLSAGNGSGNQTLVKKSKLSKIAKIVKNGKSRGRERRPSIETQSINYSDSSSSNFGLKNAINGLSPIKASKEPITEDKRESHPNRSRRRDSSRRVGLSNTLGLPNLNISSNSSSKGLEAGKASGGVSGGTLRRRSPRRGPGARFESSTYRISTIEEKSDFEAGRNKQSKERLNEIDSGNLETLKKFSKVSGQTSYPRSRRNR